MESTDMLVFNSLLALAAFLILYVALAALVMETVGASNWGSSLVKWLRDGVSAKRYLISPWNWISVKCPGCRAANRIEKQYAVRRAWEWAGGVADDITDDTDFARLPCRRCAYNLFYAMVIHKWVRGTLMRRVAASDSEAEARAVASVIRESK